MHYSQEGQRSSQKPRYEEIDDYEDDLQPQPLSFSKTPPTTLIIEQKTNEILETPNTILQTLPMQSTPVPYECPPEKPLIRIKITGREIQGSGLMKHTVYLIRGEDSNGQISAKRRFNQFFSLRAVIVRRWPGCFVPSIPSKNMLMKNDEELNRKRQRYLNDFVSKIAKLPHLYTSEEFQTLLRSKEKDLSSVYEQWPQPILEQIVTRYKSCFPQIIDKQNLPGSTNVIEEFRALIEKHEIMFTKYRAIAKELALQRDRLHQHYRTLQIYVAKLFTYVFSNYELNCLLEYVDKQESLTLYANPSANDFYSHGEQAIASMSRNPFWLLYDLIKQEEKDGKAIVQSFKYLSSLQISLRSMDIRIQDTKRSINQLESKATRQQSIPAKKAVDEQKVKEEYRLQQLTNERQTMLTLYDTISLYILNVEIERYKASKIHFYKQVMRKLATSQLHCTKTFNELWCKVAQSLAQLVTKH